MRGYICDTERERERGERLRSLIGYVIDNQVRERIKG